MLDFSLLGYVEIGFLKRYPYPCPQTDTLQITGYIIVALAQAGNQIKLGWLASWG